MTLEQQIMTGFLEKLGKQPERMKAAGLDPEDKAVTDMLAAEYLTGASQVARLLSVNDGLAGLTPQAIENALTNLGRQLGFQVQ